MHIEINLERIQKLGKEREDENLDFRIFLKGYDMLPAEMDAVVHEILDEVTSKIDCTKCANCCKQVRPVLDEDDLSRFALGLDISESELRNQFLHVNKDNPSKFSFKEIPCPFLKNDLCTNYDHRPTDCRSYPHLHKDDFIFRLWGVIGNYEICPIVFNVYEQLKIELWHNDWYEDDGSWV
jgi:hypothetical protein